MNDDLDFGATIKGLAASQKVYGRYRLERQLGRGGMGVVWRAFDEKLDRLVALKFLPEIVTSDPVAADDLKRETRRSLELTHPNIVRIYDFVDDEQSAAIAMEYVDGATLSALRIGKPDRVFSVEEISPWLRAACEALHYAHAEARIVHRDLKPANLMVTAKGQLKVADFGIARSISDSVSRVSIPTHSTSGTLAYMSPQQLIGQPPSESDDIYSLGATIYELLTGKPPFYSGNLQHQVETIVPPVMEERRTALGVVAGDRIPPAWEKTVAACLAKEPSARPQSILQVAAGLGLGLGGGAANPPVSIPGKPSPSSPSRRFALVAAGLVLLAAAVGAGWYFGIHQPAERTRLAERAERENQARAARDAEERATQEAEAAKLRAAKEKADAEAARLASARGGLEILTDPPGATVQVGGAAKGVSPITFPDLRLGKYPVIIERPGYDPVEKTLEVSENQFANPGLVKLQRSTGAAQIISTPPGQKFRLAMAKSPVAGEKASEQTGVTPATIENLPTGTYALRLSRDGWPDFSGELTVERGKVKPLTWEFAEGSTRIVSEPPGAEIFINGKSVGATPFTFSGPTGEYSVELRRPGWPAWSGPMTVAKGDSPELRWEFASGSAQIASTPPGAAFELRPKNPALADARRELSETQTRYTVKGLGAEENATLKARIAELQPLVESLEKDAKPITGTTPASLPDLPAGTYTLEVTRPGWPKQIQEITVAKDNPANASVEFSQGTLEATSTPPGVTVKVGDRTLGKTPLKTEIPNGAQTVRFELAGWPAIEKTVRVAKNSTAQAAAEFRGGALRITSVPSGATVTRDGKRLGATPLTLENQPPGSYSFSLGMEGFRGTSVNSTVKPGETVAASVEMEKSRFTGTWRGTVNIRAVSGATATDTCAVRVSADEKTVQTDIAGTGFADGFRSTARREGDALVWSFRQRDSDTGPGTWTSTCTLRITGANSASFTRNTDFIAGRLKGGWTKSNGTLTRQ
jgi:hypothetical protein